MRDVEIILTQDTKNVGKLGQRKRVKRGYAKNFLLPRGLALVVNEGNLAQFKAIEKKELKRRAKEKAAAEEIRKALEGKVVQFTAKTHTTGKLYGSITPTKVADQLHKEFKLSIDKQALHMNDHIKDVGKHAVEVEVHPEVKFKITLEIKSASESETKK